MSAARLCAAFLLVVATGTIAAARRDPVVAPAVLAIPDTIGSWMKQSDLPIDAETREAIAADQIVNRTYAGVGDTEAALYVAYYERQRPGVSIHSPLHCLPGTGWEVLSDDTVRLDAGGTRLPMRRLLAQKGQTTIMTLYWYSITGHVIASDVLSRVQLLENRLRWGRNDAALVRIVVPVAGSERDAERRAFDFARALLHYL
jgi:EpsI family protein